MNLFQAARGQYEDRLQRAQYLAKNHPFAAEFLNFYQAIAQFQKSLYARIAAGAAAPRSDAVPSPLRDSFDATLVLPHFRAFLDIIVRDAPSPLADSARQVSSQSAESWIGLLSSYWTDAGIRDEASRSLDASMAAAPFEQFIPRAFLQPHAEFLAEQMLQPVLLVTTNACPLCAGRPLAGVLRREGDGAKRFLLCSFCSQEWEFRRILCPTFGEESEGKLPVYFAEQFPHIRVEACDTCHSYLRTIDLTKDGHAVPIVDDLAALPLSLWAHEHGYARPQPNLLGT